MYSTQLHSVFQIATSTDWELKFIPHPSLKSKFKRCLDILGSLVGLLILAIVFVPIAIAIKIDSPGPIFFTQERYGHLGRRFRIRKFRSMVSNAEHLKSLVKNEAKGLIFKNKNDFRITKVGRFLRRTSLDELPQFWNVLVGEMSLVGTRPPTADEVVNYSPRHWQRLNVKPGLTGEWQVNGRSKVTDFEQIVDLDLRYQQNWHLFYDLLLIGKTFYVIFNKTGAC
ncbi:sugar transferase [Calothrix sp. NIES-2098]|uniref:sugar transferase n=1 Tax=Calothrix sp. NIES-2098 TaxID=1954171 RepID=UPI000B617487|nr:sugar transferase [Calothrix sp. NIES-2098]